MCVCSECCNVCASLLVMLGSRWLLLCCDIDEFVVALCVCVGPIKCGNRDGVVAEKEDHFRPLIAGDRARPINNSNLLYICLFRVIVIVVVLLLPQKTIAFNV